MQVLHGIWPEMRKQSKLQRCIVQLVALELNFKEIEFPPRKFKQNRVMQPP